MKKFFFADKTFFQLKNVWSPDASIQEALFPSLGPVRVTNPATDIQTIADALIPNLMELSLTDPSKNTNKQ